MSQDQAPASQSAPASGTPEPSPQQPVSQPAVPAAKPVNPPAPSQPFYAPQPVKKSGGFAKGFGLGLGASIGFGLLGTVASILFLVVAMIIGSTASNMSVPTEPLDNKKVLWGPADAESTMYAINITGPIVTTPTNSFVTMTAGYEVANILDSLDADEYQGVVMIMNTPGGSVTGSRAIGDAIVRYQERTGHKVLAYVESMSASGGMYSMAPADQIIVDHGTMTGSIGVIMGPFTHYKDVVGTTGSLLESGVQTTGGITSEYITAGRYKDFGNPFRDMSDDEYAHYQGLIDGEYDQFVSWVSKYRGISEDKIRNELGAFIFNAPDAIAVGLADKEGNMLDAFKAAAELNELDPENTRLVTPAEPSFIDQLFGAENRIYGQTTVITEGIASAEICSDSPQLLAYHGELRSVCSG